MSSRNSSSVSIRGSGSAFKPFPRNSEPTSSLSKDRDIYSDSRGMGEDSKVHSFSIFKNENMDQDFFLPASLREKGGKEKCNANFDLTRRL